MNVSLIGMPGSGKTSIGARLAERLGYGFVDVDRLIEEKTGKELHELIGEQGDDFFSGLEEETVLGLGELHDTVISPGGSVVYSGKAMEFLRRNSVVVFLDAPFELISSRLRDPPLRGIIRLGGRGLKAVYGERLPLYNKYSDIKVAVSEDSTVEDVVDEIINRLWGDSMAKENTGKITCPLCGHVQRMRIQEKACIPFYVCGGCGKTVQAEESCCVFCDYADRPCPVGEKKD